MNKAKVSFFGIVVGFFIAIVLMSIMPVGINMPKIWNILIVPIVDIIYIVASVYVGMKYAKQKNYFIASACVIVLLVAVTDLLFGGIQGLFFL